MANRFSGIELSNNYFTSTLYMKGGHVPFRVCRVVRIDIVSSFV